MKRSLVLSVGAIAVGIAVVPSSVITAAPAGQKAEALRMQAFVIANMTCATCPIAVKTAMQRVPGVQSVKVNFETKKATVTFDPARTNAAAIAAASTNAGYPAKLAG